MHGRFYVKKREPTPRRGGGQALLESGLEEEEVAKAAAVACHLASRADYASSMAYFKQKNCPACGRRIARPEAAIKRSRFHLFFQYGWGVGRDERTVD